MLMLDTDQEQLNRELWRAGTAEDRMDKLRRKVVRRSSWWRRLLGRLGHIFLWLLIGAGCGYGLVILILKAVGK